MPFRMITGSTLTNPPAAVWVPGWNQVAPPDPQTDLNTPVSNGNLGFANVVVDPTDSSVIVGTSYQGLWKSYDTGVTWTKLNTGTNAAYMDSGRIWTICIDPLNHNIIWSNAANGQGGPLKSTDGGVSWATAFCGTPTQNNDPYAIVADPYLADHVLVSWHSAWVTNGADSGVSESFDGGSTWTHHQPASTWGSGTAVFFLNNSTTWLVATQADGVWRTTNSGTSWTQVTAVNMTHGGIGCLMTPPGTTDLYMALTFQVMRSTDYGATWTNVSTGLPGFTYFDAVVTDGTNLYTSPSFPIANYVDGPWYTMPIGGSSWSTYSVGRQNMMYRSQSNGSVCGAYDSANKIGYGAHWLAGVYRIQG